MGVEYIDTPAGGSRAETAVVLELFGYEKWRYKSGKAVNRWGASVLTSFADIPGMDSVGYGLMLHTPVKNASIGIVWRDGDADSETGILINIDFAKLIQKYDGVDLDRFLGQ